MSYPGARTLGNAESLGATAVAKNFHITGYLRKRNTKSSKLLRNWDKRWFALDDEVLIYATTHKDTLPKQTFRVRDIKSVCLIEQRDDEENRFEFEVNFPDRVLRLRPKSESQRRHWVASLQRVWESQVSEFDTVSSFDNAPDSTSNRGETLPESNFAQKKTPRRNFFRRKKEVSSSCVVDLQAKVETSPMAKVIVKSVSGKSLQNSYIAEDSTVVERLNPTARGEALLKRASIKDVEADEGPSVADRGLQWRRPIRQAKQAFSWGPKKTAQTKGVTGGAQERCPEEVTAFEEDWSKWDERDLVISEEDEVPTPKRKTLSGPRTPSPELVPPRTKKQYKDNQEQRIPVLSDQVTQLYDNALFQEEQQDSDGSDWDASDVE